jgi:hypothetical protein
VYRGVTFAGQILAVVALGVVLTAAVLEIWARTQPRHYFLEFDETLGFRAQPGAVGEYRGRWLLSPNPAIRTTVRIDSRGMRGPERTAEKPPHTRRLLVLGDSFVQALEVAYEDTFYSLLEQRSRLESRPALEAIPMACSGYGQAQQLLWFQQTGVALDPDLVLIVVFLGNDVRENSAELSAGTTRPFFELRAGKLEFASAPSDAARWKYAATRYLRSYILYKEIGYHVGGLKELGSKLGIVNYAERELDGPRRIESKRSAYDLTFELVREIAREVNAAGAEALVVFHGSYPTGTNESPRQWVAQFCAQSGLNCLDIQSELEGHDEYRIPLDEHWSPAGHRRVADLIWDHWGDALEGGVARHAEGLDPIVPAEHANQ